MSATRKQLRRMRRRLAMANISNEQAAECVQAINENRQRTKEEITAEVLRKLQKEFKPKLAGEVWAEVLTLYLAFEHIEQRHTGKWLRQRLSDFMDFCDDVDEFDTSHKGKMDELKRILLDECKFDIVEEFKRSNEERKERERAKNEDDKMRAV